MLRRCILLALILGLALTLRPAGAIPPSYAYAALSFFPALAETAPYTTGFNLPEGVAVDSNGNIYVADSAAGTAPHHQVRVFDPVNHTELFDIGSTTAGAGNGQFASSIGPYGIAIDSFGNVFVTDPGNLRVEKFDHTGRFLLMFGTSGASNGEFTTACYGVAVDSSDNVFVTDYGGHRVEKFDNYGNFLAKLGTSGSGTDQFAQPYGIAIDGSNNVYVADDNNSRVIKLDDNLDSGAFTVVVTTASTTIEGVAVDSLGYVYYNNTPNGSPSEIFKVSSAGTTEGSITSNASAGTAGYFYRPFGMAVDRHAEVYIADTSTANTGKVDIFVQKPTTTPALTPTAFPYSFGTFTLTSSNTSGTPTIHYSLNGAAYATSSSPYTLDISVGLYFITYYTTDSSGDTEDPQSFIFTLTPTLFSISPAQIVTGNGATQVVINGAGFGSSNFGSTFKIYASQNGGTGIALTSPSVVNPNELIGTIPSSLVSSASPLDLYVTYSTASTSNDLVVDVGKATLVITLGTITNSSGTVTVPITIKNTGTADATNVSFNTHTLSGATFSSATYYSPLLQSSVTPPFMVTNGNEVTGTLTFTGGTSGPQTLLLKGNYVSTPSGTFSLTAKVTVP